MLLGWLSRYGQRLLIAEFDVPAFSGMYAPEHGHYILERYARGLAEYSEEQAVVAQGFLMPVMFGYFDQTRERINYEQLRVRWIAQLKAAGFMVVNAHQLYSYWWAPAYLIDAQMG